MNTVLMRRRWLVAKPWIKDIACAGGLIAFMVAGFWSMGRLADLLN